MTTWSTATRHHATDLGGGKVDLDRVEDPADDDLAAQPAAPFVPRGDGLVEHLVLVLAHLRQRVEERFADVDVAGRAHGLAAALPHDAAHPVVHGRPHQAGAVLHVQDVGAAGPVVEGDCGHRSLLVAAAVCRGAADPRVGRGGAPVKQQFSHNYLRITHLAGQAAGVVGPGARFTLRQLEYFVTVADQGTMAGAAQHHHISQSAVSLAITELERALGVQLLVRRRARGVELTGAGREVLPEVRRLLAHAAEVQATARSAG